MTIMPIFRQMTLPGEGPFYDIFVKTQKHAVGLIRSRENTPKAGCFYCNDKTGLMIFSGAQGPVSISFKHGGRRSQTIEFNPSSPGAAGGESASAQPTTTKGDYYVKPKSKEA